MTSREESNKYKKGNIKMILQQCDKIRLELQHLHSIIIYRNKNLHVYVKMFRNRRISIPLPI